MDTFTKAVTGILVREAQAFIRAILLKGSKLDPGSVDYWSDTDLVVLLHTGCKPEEFPVSDCIAAIGQLIGKEVNSGKDAMTYRLVLEWEKQIHLLDLQLLSADSKHLENDLLLTSHKRLYGTVPDVEPRKAEVVVSMACDLAKVDFIWFLFFLCVKKWKRKDHLIGMHLMLEIIQENLVLLMIDRDVVAGTNIHRFGQSESLPVFFKKINFQEQSTQECLDIIFHIAKWLDDRLLQQVENYESRLPYLGRYIHESRMQD